MKFTEERKRSIIQYILLKISENTDRLSYHVSEALGISSSTVYNYLGDLLKNGVIVKDANNSYSLKNNRTVYTLSKADGDKFGEEYIYNKYILPIIADLPVNVKSIWDYSFGEMINNAIEHSECKNIWLIVENNILKTDAYIMDDGIGVFKKIKEHFDYLTLDDAVVELSKGKLTTDSEHHSGEGVFFTSRIMDDFMIYSDHKVFTFNKYQESLIANIKKEYSFSTCVYMSLSNNSKKNIADVFNEFTNVDNGFVKTLISLKNIFDSAPVSRSQAKRICNRLEQFKEVEIDFDGIEFVGQGFAHELFYVFANAHPDIKLIPLNMNYNVTMMYNHVATK